MTRHARGFTLVELLLALAIVGALLAMAFGGLRVAVASWQRGEDRAEAHQHVRSVALTLARAVSAAYPYRASRTQTPEPVVLFAGTDKRVEFVSQSAPFPFSIPIAFTAVVLTLDDGEPGLTVRQRALPNQDPFEKAEVVYRDATVTALKFEYLDESGSWKDTWDGAESKATPKAVRITVATNLNGRPEALPPITVSLRVAPPQ